MKGRCLHRKRRVAWLVVALGALVALGWPGLLTQAQGANLLQNPGFERPYVAMSGMENIRTAAPWVPYWFQGSPEETREGYRLAPEYKAAFRDDFPGNRVRSGELAQQYFHSFGNFQGGVYQQVSNIPVGARLRLELWGMTWSCDDEKKGNCARATSGDPSPMRFRIGIDPQGGLNALDPGIAWSPEQNAYDAWHLFQVEAVARSSTVTVFVYAYPEYRSQDNNVYIDDAVLQVVAPPPTPTRRPTNTPLPTEPPTATPVPTNTPVPTDTPAPTATTPPTATMTATPLPTDTPLPSATATGAPAAATATPESSVGPQPAGTDGTTAPAPSRPAASNMPLWYLVGIAVVLGALIAALVTSRNRSGG